MLSMKLNSNVRAPACAKSKKYRGERKKAMTKYTNRFFRQFGCVWVSASVTLSKYKKKKKKGGDKTNELIFLNNSNVRACVRYIKKYKREKKAMTKYVAPKMENPPKYKIAFKAIDSLRNN